MKILIADDSKLSRATLAAALLKLDHEVIEAENGEQAIEYFKSKYPDLVILNVVMEGMSGFECARQIREFNKTDWIPIIFLSNSLDDGLISKGIDAGGDDYLTKPFSQLALSAKIKAMQRIADMRANLVELTYKLNLLSYTDSLTGLANRLQFTKKLKESVSDAKRHQKGFALIFIDVDHFKKTNDTFGHYFGDLLLIEVAKRIKSCIRLHDFVARLGGDEFAIVLSDMEEKRDIETVAKKIIAEGYAPFHLEGKEVHISFSIGIALFPEDAKEHQRLISNADKAMYVIKNQGRNAYQFYSKDL